jgi:hypothetical protein
VFNQRRLERRLFRKLDDSHLVLFIVFLAVGYHLPQEKSNEQHDNNETAGGKKNRYNCTSEVKEKLKTKKKKLKEKKIK